MIVVLFLVVDLIVLGLEIIDEVRLLSEVQPNDSGLRDLLREAIVQSFR